MRRSDASNLREDPRPSLVIFIEITMAGDVLLDARRIKAFEGLGRFGDYAGRDKEWLDMLWSEMVEEPKLMKESMVLGAFHDMACMIKESEKYIKKLSDGPGMDRL